VKLARIPAVLVALTLMAAPALAQDREVMGEELETLLSGNSIDGVWGQGHYVQHFQENGRTVYVADGRAPDWGTWRISSAGRYCSVWRGGGESCYPVIERDGVLHWLVESTGVAEPFTVVEGNITLQ
jgi:hypothetical protein